MKKFTYFIFSALLLSFLMACTSRTALSADTVDKLINSEEFTFMAERAQPMGGDINNVLASMRNTQILDLTYGDGIVFKENLAQVHLPYFGRVYNPSLDPSKSGFIFESKDFNLDKIKNEEGKWIIRFSPKDQNHIRFMQLEIFKNGRAYLSVDATDRQAINYTGYIIENSSSK